jgi:hypothetical protein
MPAWRKIPMNGDGPHHGLETLDGDPEQAGPIGPLGAGPDSDADTRESQHQCHTEQRQGGDNQCSQMICREDEREDREGQGNRDVDHAGGRLLPPDHGDEQRTCHEQLGQPDGGHREDQPWGVEESPDDDQLHNAAQKDGGR